MSNLNDTPPPRVWGAEAYNKSNSRVTAERLGAKALANALWLLKMLLTPFTVAASFLNRAYWGIHAEPRGTLGAVSGGIAMTWGVCYLGAQVGFGFGDAARWWTIPFVLTAIIAIALATVFFGVLCSLKREEVAEILSGRAFK